MAQPLQPLLQARPAAARPFSSFLQLLSRRRDLRLRRRRPARYAMQRPAIRTDERLVLPRPICQHRPRARGGPPQGLNLDGASGVKRISSRVSLISLELNRVRSWHAVDLRSRCSGPKPTRQEGRQTPAPQAFEETATSASRADHRPAEKLRRGQARDHAWRRAPPAQGSEQPGREFAPTDARRERIMKRFKAPRHVQRFLSIHDQIANVFSRHPDQDTAATFQSARNQHSSLGPR
jgi:hypothetical protein